MGQLYAQSHACFEATGEARAVTLVPNFLHPLPHQVLWWRLAESHLCFYMMTRLMGQDTLCHLMAVVVVLGCAVLHL